MPDRPEMTAPPLTVESLLERLRAYADEIHDKPLTNSVFSLALSLFQDLDSGRASLDDFAGLIDTLHYDLLCGRAERFRAQHATGEDPWASVRKKLEVAAKKGLDTFTDAAGKLHGGIVFTAHPTFALSRELREAFAAYVTDGDDASKQALCDEANTPRPDWPDRITLLSEHDEAQQAIANARAAGREYAGLVLSVAREAFPESWRSFRPVLPTIASWVGYDLDGRTDIHWSQSIALRLKEKASQLAYYEVRLSALKSAASGTLDGLIMRLGHARTHTEKAAAHFEGDLFDPDTLIRAANFLTTPSDDKLTDHNEITAQLDEVIADRATSEDLAAELAILRAEIETLGLGTARIHLRVNAAQVRTVLSRDLNLETEDRELGRLALSQLSEMAETEKVRPVNFADLFIEQSTARRQFMMCAQILKHIDAHSPIRFLIAESENPATVMGALYLARQYGVDHALDISPLFETPEALETGGRFVERLLEENAFCGYVRARGYLSIQLGFSDSGRFIGQVAGNMAIERIHNLIGRALARKLPGMGLLFFNTHGESMGRGAYPGSFEKRFNHLLTPWTRAGLKQRDIHPIHEVSFQGGDGFLHFATPALSRATHAAWCEHALSASDDVPEDPFYMETDFVWDAYRALRHWHEKLFTNEDYARLLGGFAAGFLVKAGSRPVKRAGSAAGPSAIRAISHNALLQQLGIPLNSACGIGSSMPRETERLKDLINASPRLHSLVMLACHARMLTSLPAMRGYASVFDPEVWLALSRYGEGEHEEALRRVADALSDYTTNTSFKRIANILSVDLIQFDRLLAELDEAPSIETRHEARLHLHTLHAIRQAVMMYAVSLVGRLRNFSARHDTSLDDLIGEVLNLRIGEAVSSLETIYPASRNETDLIAGMSENGFERSDSTTAGYDTLHREVIDPLRLTDELIHRISVATCHTFDAWG